MGKLLHGIFSNTVSAVRGSKRGEFLRVHHDFTSFQYCNRQYELVESHKSMGPCRFHPNVLNDLVSATADLLVMYQWS